MDERDEKWMREGDRSRRGRYSAATMVCVCVCVIAVDTRRELKEERENLRHKASEDDNLREESLSMAAAGCLWWTRGSGTAQGHTAWGEGSGSNEEGGREGEEGDETAHTQPEGPVIDDVTAGGIHECTKNVHKKNA